jgi:hypothetical protein
MKLSAIIEGLDFDDLFGPDKERPTIVSTSEPQQAKYTLELYRGFDVDVDQLERRGKYYILSPKRSEQGLIWFTHKLIQGYNPIEYVQGRGSHILTYPLQCIRHFQTIKWSDGSTSTSIPQEILDATEPTQNGRYHMGIELPPGWVFSYKYEKFIGCSVELQITPDMLTPQK